MIETNCVPIYRKIYHIFFNIKGGLYFQNNNIVLHSILYLCIMSIFCITCMRLSLTPPVSGLRCIVFNKVMFCLVLF